MGDDNHAALLRDAARLMNEGKPLPTRFLAGVVLPNAAAEIERLRAERDRKSRALVDTAESYTELSQDRDRLRAALEQIVSLSEQDNRWHGPALIARRALAGTAAPATEPLTVAEWVWFWIDRLARGTTTQAEALSVLTHHPAAPEWVHRVGAAVQPAATPDPLGLIGEGLRRSLGHAGTTAVHPEDVGEPDPLICTADATPAAFCPECYSDRVSPLIFDVMECGECGHECVPLDAKVSR